MLRSSHPFLMFGGLGAVVLTALSYVSTALLKNWLASSSTVAISNETTPLLCLACVIGVGIPAVSGFLAARSSGFTFIGGAAGALVYVGYDLARLVLDPILVHVTATPLDANGPLAISCQGILGFFFGALGGMAGRRFYQELPPYREQAYWEAAPYMPYGSYGPGGYAGSPPPPSGPYGSPPAYRAGYGPESYSPPQNQPPQRYQPGAAPSPSTYPAPGYNQSPGGYGHSGMPAQGDAGASWNVGWPPSGGDMQPNEDDSAGPWHGWQTPPA